jgi:hypothetical protein
MPISLEMTRVKFACATIMLSSCMPGAVAAPDADAPSKEGTPTQHHTFSGFSTDSNPPSFMSAPRLSTQEETALITPKNPRAAAEHNKQVTMRSYPWSGPALIQPFKFPKSIYDHLHRHDPEITQRVQPGDFLPPQRRIIFTGRGTTSAPPSFNFLQYAQSIKH